MAEPFIGEIQLFGFDYAPQGWVFCDGQLLPVIQYQALFAVIGITYGGDGVNNFGVPNLTGRIPIGFGQGLGLSSYSLGTAGGYEAVRLELSEIPNHNHELTITNNDAATNNPAGLYPSKHQDDEKGYMYKTDPNLNAVFADSALSSTGGNQGHYNNQPFLPMNFCIAVEGIFPVRT